MSSNPVDANRSEETAIWHLSPAPSQWIPASAGTTDGRDYCVITEVLKC